MNTKKKSTNEKHDKAVKQNLSAPQDELQTTEKTIRISKRGRVGEGNPPKFKSPADVEAKIDSWIAQCRETKEPVTVSGLAVALNCEIHNIHDYNTRRGSEYARVIKKGLLACEKYAEDRLFQSQQCTGAIFALKNRFGWRDVQEKDHRVQINYTVPPSNKRKPLLRGDEIGTSGGDPVP